MHSPLVVFFPEHCCRESVAAAEGGQEGEQIVGGDAEEGVDILHIQQAEAEGGKQCGNDRKEVL